MLNATVRNYLDRNRPEHLSRLLELVRIPSVANTRSTPDPCRQAAEWLVRHLREIGLSATIAETGGKPCVLASGKASSNARTLLIYGHYDVQPPDPLELWTTGPFEPVLRDGCIWARGASDDKGQIFIHLLAVEAWQQAGGGLPVNVKFLFEGEEETGSPTLEPFVAAHRDELAADVAVISDSEFFARGLPSITYALRGLAYVEVIFHGPPARPVAAGSGGRR